MPASTRGPCTTSWRRSVPGVIGEGACQGAPSCPAAQYQVCQLNAAAVSCTVRSCTLASCVLCAAITSSCFTIIHVLFNRRLTSLVMKAELDLADAKNSPGQSINVVPLVEMAKPGSKKKKKAGRRGSFTRMFGFD